MTGKKFDDTKPKWNLLPLSPIAEVVNVLTFGANKYGPNNWQLLPDFNERYFAATMRHLFAWREGETHDPESGLHHLAHAATNIIFLLWGNQDESQLSIRKDATN